MNKKNFTIISESVTKKFSNTTLFNDLNFSLQTGESLSITGPNGSGKSTLLQIIAGLQKPTSGNIDYIKSDKIIPKTQIYDCIGFTSPLMNPYEELTGYENINFALKQKKNEPDIKSILEKFNIHSHKDKIFKYYSSGMKQRLKLILAIINDPPIMLFDEPGANLDKDGKKIIYSYIASVRKDKIIIIATNEKKEAVLCREVVKLG